MALLNSYQNTFAAYSLRKTYSSYSGPLIRLYRDFDAVEADVFADQNGEVSFDSPISVGKQSSSAVVLGEFVGKSGYRNPDSLMSLSVGRISKIYDQSVNANHFLSSTVAKMPLLFDASGTEEIYKINDAPAYFVSQGMNNTLNEGIQLPDVGVEFSMYLSARSSSATPTAFGFSVHDTSNFIIFPNISFFYNSKIISSSPDYYVLNNVRYNTRQGDIYSPTQYELPVVPSDGVYLFSLNVVRPDTNENQLFPETQKVTPWNGHIYSDVIIYEGYDPQRDYAVESFMADEFQAVTTKALVEQSTPDGFLTQFPNAAAAYSVRSLRGLTGLNGPKVLRVRREVDNAEVDVYTDSTGWVSLDSPVVIVPAITGQIDGGTGVEIESLASTLGEFVADADHDDVDSLGSPTTANVVVWYDQSSADYTIISEEIDARGAPVRIRVVGGTYDAYEFDLYFDDNESISLSSYVADTYEISDGATQVTANLTLGTLQTLVDAGMTEATVCVWYDQSGNANDATQTTTGSQPTIFTGGAVVIENGKPAVSYNGTSQYFTFNGLVFNDSEVSIFNVYSSANAAAADATGVMLWAFGTQVNGEFYINKPTGTSLLSGEKFVYALGTNSVTGGRIGSSTFSRSADTLTLDADFFLQSGINAYSNSSSVTLDLSHNWTTSTDSRFSSSIDDNHAIGSVPTSYTVFAEQKTSELIIYASDKSTDRTGIEATINTYYDIYGTGNTGVNTPLLDTYSDAVAAYSLRKLRTSYNGPVNLSKRKDAIQNVATNQPKIYDGTSGVVTENGKPAVDFDGNDDFFPMPSAALPSNINNASAFAVYSRASATSSNSHTVYSLGVPNVRWYGSYMYDITNKEYFSYGSDFIVHEIQQADIFQHIITNIAGSTQGDARAFLDGTLTVTTSLQSATPTAGAIGASNNTGSNLMDGNIQELVIYHSDKSTARTSIESNINSAFQIYAANFSSVLDSVPLAKAAYSIRRLTKNYIGPIITVSNGSTTKDFYADFWGNLDVNALTSFANGGTLSVTKWWDQSGEGVHLLTTSTRPTLSIANNEVSIDTTNKFYEPLLDRYEGAAAAYSLRVLKGDYTGPLVRVRRDVTNTEVDVYPDENLTISLNSPVLNVTEATTGVIVNPADTLATTLGEFVADAAHSNPDSLVVPASAFVVVWYDQANSNNASQDISTAQPKIYDSVNGVVTENGKAAVDFDGSSHSLTISNNSLHRNVGYVHLYAVNTSDVVATNQTFYFAATGDNGNAKARVTVGIQSTNEFISGGRRLDSDSFSSVLSSATSSINTQYLRVSEFDYASSDLNQYINGTLDGTSSSFQTDGNTSDTDSLNSTGHNITIGSIGGSLRNYNGTLQEIVIYNADKSGNRTGIESNINNHYQIPNFNATASTAQTVAVYNNAINTTVDLNATYTDLKEIIKYE